MAPSARTHCARGALVIAALLACAALAAGRAGAIVGGNPVSIRSVPWTVFVQDARGATIFSCTGSILDATHVLTAAHCLYDRSGRLAQPADLSIEAGVSNTVTPLPTDAPQRVSVRALRIHPGYLWSARSPDDDVAILTLSTPLDLSGPDARPVRLPAAGIAFPGGERATVAGYGSQRAGVLPDGALESMDATVDPQGRCGQSPSIGLLPGDAITLCARAPSATTCTGDSGAGLMTAGSTPMLIGVVDIGSVTCAPGSQTVFSYLGAAELRRFILGDDDPPVAPRASAATFVNLSWSPPLVVGATLECSSGDWGRPVSLRYTFVTTSGQTLASGSRRSYTLEESTGGERIACALTASDAGGSAFAQTPFTPAIAPAPALTIAPIPPLDARRGEAVVLHVSLHAPRGLSGRFGACVTPPAAVGGRDCSSLSDQLGGGGWFTFVLSIRVSPTAPLGRTRLTIDAVAGAASAHRSVGALIGS